MTLCIAIGALAGALLGLRFVVWVLGPAIAIVAAMTTVSGIEGGVAATVLAFTLIEVVAAVQLGYLAGCVVRPGLAGATPLSRDDFGQSARQPSVSGDVAA
jgi:hypothetical protein